MIYTESNNSQSSYDELMYKKNKYLKPDKNRTMLSEYKQMEYNKKYSKQLDYLKYLSEKYNFEFRIAGGFNTYLHIDDKSDIDIYLYTKNPYILYHNLKNELMYRKLMQRDYNYEMPCGSHICKKKGTLYKLDFFYGGVDMSLMIIDNKDKPFFNGAIKERNILMYYFGFILAILKYIYYNFNIMSKKFYKKAKALFFNNENIMDYKIRFNDNIIQQNS